MATNVSGSGRALSTHRTVVAAAPPSSIGAMNALRRALIALGVTAVAAAIVRLRGSGGTPPQRGGWRELPESELL